jgi:hypothetical protein
MSVTLPTNAAIVKAEFSGILVVPGFPDGIQRATELK